uniref:Uncharacterized protein n=1 Tax=Tetranychus urticae TaxID=32264 RepID=T1KYF4_TETUR
MAQMHKKSEPNVVVKMCNKVKLLYTDPFLWQVVKSWSLFSGGVYLARALGPVISDNMEPV